MAKIFDWTTVTKEEREQAMKDYFDRGGKINKFERNVSGLVYQERSTWPASQKK